MVAMLDALHWSRRLPAVAILATALTVSGCLKVDTVPVDDASSVAKPAQPAASVSTSSGAGRWTDLDGKKCPRFTGTAAKSLRLAEDGTSQSFTNNIGGLIASCTWGQGAGSVSVVVSMGRYYANQTAEQMAEKSFREEWAGYIAEPNGLIVQSQPEPGLADEAHLGMYRDKARLMLLIRSSNVTAKIVYWSPQSGGFSWNLLITQYREIMRGLASDVLDDLS